MSENYLQASLVTKRELSQLNRLLKDRWVVSLRYNADLNAIQAEASNATLCVEKAATEYAGGVEQALYLLLRELS